MQQQPTIQNGSISVEERQMLRISSRKRFCRAAKFSGNGFGICARKPDNAYPSPTGRGGDGGYRIHIRPDDLQGVLDLQNVPLLGNGKDIIDQPVEHQA